MRGQGLLRSTLPSRGTPPQYPRQKRLASAKSKSIEKQLHLPKSIRPGQSRLSNPKFCLEPNLNRRPAILVHLREAVIPFKNIDHSRVQPMQTALDLTVADRQLRIIEYRL